MISNFKMIQFFLDAIMFGALTFILFTLKEFVRMFDEKILRIVERIERQQNEQLAVQNESLQLLRILAYGRPVTYLTITQENSMSQQPDPGAVLQLQITPNYLPGAASPVPLTAANMVWSSSDTTNGPVAVNTADPTGATASVSIPTSAVVGTQVNISATFTNPDGTQASGQFSFTIGAPPPPPVSNNVQSLTIAQTN